ncbi:MAG TPA: serine acetyltransferase [Polyangia bacterium]|jgi:serine O-acetyltransferase
MSSPSVLRATPGTDLQAPVDIVDELCAANETLLRGRWQRRGGRTLPSRTAVVKVMEDLRAALFPGHFGATDLTAPNLRSYVSAKLDRVQVDLTEQIRRALSFTCQHDLVSTAGECRACADQAGEVSAALVSRLPGIRRLLESDLQAAYASDPAARLLDETLYCYPGILAITNHRLAHELHRLAVPLLPRMISELAHSATGIDIHPGAQIGPHFFIDHGTGVVIGETCVIGSRVRLYQGVTLGARRTAVDPDGFLARGQPRHPLIDDDVVIYAGATILGRITIGAGATIGGNVWLTRDVAPGARVTQAFLQHNAVEDRPGA